MNTSNGLKPVPECLMVSQGPYYRLVRILNSLELSLLGGVNVGRVFPNPQGPFDTFCQSQCPFNSVILGISVSALTNWPVHCEFEYSPFCSTYMGLWSVVETCQGCGMKAGLCLACAGGCSVGLCMNRALLREVTVPWAQAVLHQVMLTAQLGCGNSCWCSPTSV